MAGKPAEDMTFVTCQECGHEQADMGHAVACEECGETMPTNAQALEGVTMLAAGSKILNAYQDIEDELDKKKPSLKRIRAFNAAIGKSIRIIIPE